jgi:hypothetical protein
MTTATPELRYITPMFLQDVHHAPLWTSAGKHHYPAYMFRR